MKNRLGRKLALGAASVAGIVTLTAGPALADDCVNLSRNVSEKSANGAKTLETPFGEIAVKGNWVDVGGIWLFISPGTETLMGVDTSGMPGAEGNFTDGKGDGLLEQPGSASDGRRCAAMESGHGIAGECGEDQH